MTRTITLIININTSVTLARVTLNSFRAFVTNTELMYKWIFKHYNTANMHKHITITATIFICRILETLNEK